MKVPVVHLTTREGLTSVYVAQVAKPMGMMGERGFDVKLLALAPIGEYFRSVARDRWERRFEEVRNLTGWEVQRLPSPPSRMPRLWSEFPLLVSWFGRRFDRDQAVILHCRGHRSSHFALHLRRWFPNVRVLYDCRGLSGVEYAYCRGYANVDQAPKLISERARSIETEEQKAAVGADRMICVSNAMKRTVCRRWGLNADKITVIPCCTDVEAGVQGAQTREAMREKLGLTHQFTVAYCGSLEPWQMPGACLALFNAITGFRPNAHLLAITTSPDKMNQLADQANVPDSSRTILSVPQAEVASYLSVADCGLLVRDQCLVNEVASPVKFAEYLAVGVPVIISPSIGDYSELVAQKRIGCLLPSPGSFGQADGAVPALQRFLLHDNSSCRKRCLSTARECLDWTGAAGRLCDLYEQLAMQNPLSH